jgi:hypothetical protein
LVVALTWGRDELGLCEMWNSNSIIAWLLLRSGHDLRHTRPPSPRSGTGLGQRNRTGPLDGQQRAGWVPTQFDLTGNAHHIEKDLQENEPHMHGGGLLQDQVTPWISVSRPQPPASRSMNCRIDRREENHCTLTWPNMVSAPAIGEADLRWRPPESIIRSRDRPAALD